MFNKKPARNNNQPKIDGDKSLPAISYILFMLILITIPMII